MDVATLVRVMPGLPSSRAERFIDGCNEALRLIGAVGEDRVVRAAHFLSQVGHESVSLRYTEEIASGADYEGRRDLGNTWPGDGVRFKGRSFIQITGRHNYTNFSRWAASEGLISDPLYFVNNSHALADDRWAWVGATWYWLTQRPLNQLADSDDIYAVTRAINGGLMGIDDRVRRYNLARSLGGAILPIGGSAHRNEDGFLMALGAQDQQNIYDAVARIDAAVKALPEMKADIEQLQRDVSHAHKRNMEKTEDPNTYILAAADKPWRLIEDGRLRAGALTREEADRHLEDGVDYKAKSVAEYEARIAELEKSA